MYVEWEKMRAKNKIPTSKTMVLKHLLMKDVEIDLEYAVREWKGLLRMMILIIKKNSPLVSKIVMVSGNVTFS